MDFQVQMNHSWVKQWDASLLMAIVAAMLGLGLESVQASPQKAANAQACPAILNHTVDRLQD